MIGHMVGHQVKAAVGKQRTYLGRMASFLEVLPASGSPHLLSILWFVVLAPPPLQSGRASTQRFPEDSLMETAALEGNKKIQLEAVMEEESINAPPDAGADADALTPSERLSVWQLQGGRLRIRSAGSEPLDQNCRSDLQDQMLQDRSKFLHVVHQSCSVHSSFRTEPHQYLCRNTKTSMNPLVP